MKACPFCAEEIQDAAIKCRFCGSMLNQSIVPASTRPLADEFEDVRELAGQGKKVEAIKLLRDRNPGLGLKEAKAFVENPGAVLPVFRAVVRPTDPASAAVTPSVPASGNVTPAKPSAPLKLGPIIKWGYGALFLIGGLFVLMNWNSTPKVAPASTPATVAEAVVPADKRPTTGSVGPPPAATTTPQPKAAPKPKPGGDDAVSKMVTLGLIKRMDLKTGKFYIDGELWVGFELDAKQNIVRVISNYRDVHYGLPQVTLYESRSGKELANYGAFSGVTIR